MSTVDNKPQLMVTDEQQEEVIDFLNYSLSDGCFSWKDNKSVQARQVSPNSRDSSSQKDNLNSNIGSPHGQNRLLTTKLSTDQKSKQNTETYPSSPNQKVYTNLIQYFYMRKFIYQISWKKKLNSLFNQYHFDVINDKGAVFNLRLFRQNAIQMKPIIQKPIVQNKKRIVQTLIDSKQQLKNLYNFLEIILQKIPLIYPESRVKVFWDVIVMLSRFYFIFVIPLDLSWDNHQFMFVELLDSTIVMIVILILDLILSFNNAFYEFGQIVTDRSKIAYQVISRGYGTEVLSLFLLIFFLIFTKVSETATSINDSWYYLLLLLFLVHYKNIAKLTEQVEEAMNLSKPVSSLLELMKLILLLFYVLHIFTCLWFWVGNYSSKTEGKSWLITKEFQDSNWNVQYLYSFYFSTVTMFTVGYGDITPQTQIETIICIGFMMFCSIQLSYSVSTVGAIIDKISIYSKEKMRKVHTINTYMQNKKISYELQYQIREYLNYFWQSSSQEETDEEKDIINQLSVNLRERLMFESNSLILNSCPLFRNHFSLQLKKKLVKQIKSILVQPENIIDFDTIFADSKNQLYICFIESGSIQIFIENELQKGNITNDNNISVVSNVAEGSSLGMMSFITGIKAKERFKSVGFTKLLLLSRDDFLRTIPEFPEDFEIFREMQDDLIYNSDSKFLQLSCFSCQSRSHRAIACPLLHFIPDNEFLIKRHQYSQDQKRNDNGLKNQKFLRNPFRTRSLISALSNLGEIQESANYIQNDCTKFFSFYDDDEDDNTNNNDSKTETDYILPPQSHNQNLNQYPLQNQQSQNSSHQLQRKSTQNMSTASSHKYNNNKFMASQNLDEIEEEEEELQQNTYEYLKQQEQLEQQQSSKKMNSTVTRKSALKYLARKSQSIVVDQLQFQPKGIQKFKRAVEMIRSLNKIQNKKTMKVQTRNLLQSMFGSQIKNQNLYQLQKQIEKRLNKINQNFHDLSEKDIESLKFLKMKINMLLYDGKQQGIDSVRIYKFYYQQNNIDQVLEQYQQFYVPQLKKHKNIPEIFSQLVKYLLYPYVYINKYKFRAENFEYRKNKQQVYQRKKIETTHRQSKLKNGKIKKIAQIRHVGDLE